MKKADGGTFTGTCQAGDSFTGEECNTKVIGARYFSSTYKSQNPASQRTDFLSPRDGYGHGTHVASTAAGNAGVSASVAGHSFGKISGIAPAAKLAVYKVAFTSKTDEDAVVYTGDALAAIDAAITDGVDVINYSVSSSDYPRRSGRPGLPVRGVGWHLCGDCRRKCGAGRVHLEPRRPLGHHRRCEHGFPYAGTVVLGNGKKYAGISTTVFGKVGSARLVTARSVKRASAAGGDADVCASDSLSHAKAAGKIVVCDRGVVDRATSRPR